MRGCTSLRGDTPDALNGRCRPHKQGSSQKTKKFGAFFVKMYFLGILGRGYCPSAPGCAYGIYLRNIEKKSVANLQQERVLMCEFNCFGVRTAFRPTCA